MRTRRRAGRAGAQELQHLPGGKRNRSGPFAIALAAAVAAAGVAGCGSEPSRSVPAACLQGRAALESALASAPGDVRIGGRPLSGCFAHASSQGDVENLGSIFVEAAEHLATQVRASPHGPALLQLGFLIGAAHRGGDRAQGIYSELLRRLDSVLVGIDTGSAAYRRGRAAGQGHG
jgi:hypothetical protein